MRIMQVDAFTDRPFAGNPAAVCVLQEPRGADWMQDVAREMNLSETAFLMRQEDGSFNLRWFTPGAEVDLCGHATLASAHVLWEDGYLRPGQPARFHTRSGLLTARQQDGWIELDFPAEPAEEIASPIDWERVFGVRPKYVGKNRMDYIVEVASEDEVRNLNVDFGLLKALGVRGVIVTSRASTGQFDFVSRFFAPGVGVDEDPVTGSAHCCLGPYWQRQLGKSTFLAYQASRRGGILKVSVVGDRVLISGKAVTVLRGELLY